MPTCWFVVVVALAAPVERVVEQQGVRAVVHLNDDRVGLAESLTLTLTLTGPAPLIVHPQPELGVGAAWRATPREPAALTTLAGMATWRRRYRLVPFVPATDLPLTLAPVALQAGPPPSEPFTITLPTIPLTVTTTRPVATPGEPEPLPSPEPPRSAPTANGDWRPWLGIAGLTVAMLVLAWLGRPVRPRPPPTPHAWIEAALARAHTDNEVAAAVRGFLARRDGFPAEHLTTAEWDDTLAAAGWSAERRGRLLELLESCDRARFGRESAAIEPLLAQARAWLVSDSACCVDQEIARIS